MRRKITVCVISTLVLFATIGSAGVVIYNEDAVRVISNQMGIELPQEWKIEGGVSSSIIMQSGRFAVYHSDSNPFESLIQSVPKGIRIESIKRFHDRYNKMRLEAVSWDISDNDWVGYRLTKETIPQDLFVDILSKKSKDGWKICCMAYIIDKELDYEIQEVYNWWLSSQKEIISKELFDRDQSALEPYILILTHAPYFSLWRNQNKWMFYGHGYKGIVSTAKSEPSDVVRTFITENRKKITMNEEEDPLDPFNSTISENQMAIYTVEFLEQILEDSEKWKILNHNKAGDDNSE